MIRHAFAGIATAAFLAAPLPGLAQTDAAPPAEEHAGHEHHQPPQIDRETQIEQARGYFSDVVLVNQDGEELRLYSDLLQGKTVVISPFFTTCTAVCPVLSQKLAAVQRKFEDHLGKDLHLISISVDPDTDTVPRLKAYAAGFNAKPGWHFVAGKKENVHLALYKLGQYVEDKDGHTNILIIGNETTGLWKKVFGLGPTEDIVNAVEEVLHDRGP